MNNSYNLINNLKNSDFEAFFKTLTNNQLREFEWRFIKDPAKNKRGIGLHINSGDSETFFKEFVRLSSFYKNKLSAGLLFKIFEFAKTYYFDASEYAYVEDKQIKLFYSLKHNPIARKICKDLCYQKTLETENLKNNIIYLKLLVDLEAEDEPKKAVELCQKVLKLNVSEKLKNRFLNILNKLEKSS